MNKKTITFFLALITIFVLICLPAQVTLATEEDEKSGLQADTLTINIGYFGGPYYQKKVFTVNELTALGLVSTVYSHIDSMPSVCLDYATGVPLRVIMKAAGIDINSIQKFDFYTVDKNESYFTSFTKKALLDTTRYYYPNLIYNYYNEDYEKAAAGAVPVETIMAVSDNWQRHLPESDNFGKIDYSQRTLTRFRLLFGQTDTSTPTAYRSAKWVHAINVTLGGSPTITTDISVLEKEVGSKYRITATVTAADDLLAECIKQSLKWSTSNPNVAIIDDAGNVVITGPGSADIEVSYGEKKSGVISKKVQVKGIQGSPGQPSSSGPPSGSNGGVTDPDQPADRYRTIGGIEPPFTDKGPGGGA